MKLELNSSVEYVRSFLSKTECDALYDHLTTHSELTTMLVIETATGETFQNNYGKMMFIDKKLNDENKFPESIWGPTKIWSEEMKMVKDRVESYTGHQFKTCVCIYYPDGNSGVAYHSDLVAFGDTTLIPSLSLGEERIFKLREKETLLEHEILLNNGSLIIMGEHCQDRYEHSLPENSKYKDPRINLTFRKYGFQ